MAEERLGASFSIDVSQLQAGLKTANRLIRESQSEFKAAAAGMDDWRKSEEGLTARNQALTQQMQIQQTKVDALKQNYQNLINQGLDPTSDRAIQLRTQINNEEAALNKCKTEIDKNTKSMSELGDESEEAGKDAEKGSEGFTVMKGVLANLATEGIKAALNGLKNLGAAAINLGKSAIESYANYEQLVGGVETLFGAGGMSVEEYAKSVGKSVKDVQGEYNNLMTAQDTMIRNANDAYKTAGMSANEYMENVTGFSASLISSLDGDTVKAADAANRAMIDISDNANKMGTDMGSIVETYQSLARGNYQMLDNLKLGYGGTKTEMERMIADANKVKEANGEMGNLSVNSFADITEAIHIIQDEMGITGTTSREASTTIQGSIGMMQSSWQNLLTGMADETMDFDQLISNFIDSIGAVAQNLIPRITIVMQGILQLIQSLLPQIPPLLQEFLPELVQGVMDLINGLIPILPTIVDTIMQVLPMIIDALMQMLPVLLSTILTMLPSILTTLVELLTQIISAIADMLPSVIDAIIEVIPLLIDALIKALPKLLQAAVKLLMAIVQAIPKIIPPLMKMLPKIINTLVTFLIQNLPTLVRAAIQLFMALVQAIPQVLPAIIKAIPQIIKAIFTALTNPSAINSIKQAGKDLVSGLWNGLKNSIGWIKEKITGWVGDVMSFIKKLFGIHSPSTVMRDEVGKQLALGLIKGIDGQKKNAKKSAAELADLYVKAAKDKVKLLSKQNKITVQDEIDLWDQIVKSAKKGSKGYKEARQQLASAQQTYRKQSLKYEEEYSKGVAKVEEQLVKDIQKVVSAYDEAVAKRTDSIKSQFNFFDGFSYGTKKTAEGVIKNMSSQVNAIQRWDEALDKLAGRKGVTKGLIAELQQLGISETGNIELLANMSDTELKEYIRLWKERNNLAKQRALEENAELEIATRKEVASLTKNANKSLDKLEKTYMKNMGSLQSKTKDKSKQIGQNIVKGLMAGIKSENKEFQKYLTDFFTSITSTAKKSLKIHSPSKVMKDVIGKNIALGIVEGFDENIKGLNASIKGISPDITKTVDVGMRSNGISAGHNVVVNQTNNYTQQHSRYEIYKSKQQAAAAVRLALGTN